MRLWQRATLRTRYALAFCMLSVVAVAPVAFFANRLCVCRAVWFRSRCLGRRRPRWRCVSGLDDAAVERRGRPHWV